MYRLSSPAILCLLAVVVREASAIYCYQCNSHFDKECENVRMNDTMSLFYRECGVTAESKGKELFCRKTVQLILDEDYQHTRVIRSCGWVRHPKYDCYSFSNKGHEEESCTCYYDGCNSAPLTASVWAAVLLSPLLAVFSLAN